MQPTISDVLQDELIPRLAAGDGRFFPLPADGENRTGALAPAAPEYDLSHAHLEIMWLLDGAAHIDIAGKVFSLQPGDFCFIAPYMTHAELYDARTPPYRSLWFSYFAGRIGSALFSYQPVGRGEIISYAPASAPPSMEEVLSALLSEMPRDDASTRETICRPLILALAHLWKRSLDETEVARDGAISSEAASQRALHFLEAYYAKPLTLSDVARAANLSPSHLAAVFKRETGKTVIEALTEIRLRHARRLLLERNSSVGRIARACGFGSIEHFSRVFRRAENVPPSCYGK